MIKKRKSKMARKFKPNKVSLTEQVKSLRIQIADMSKRIDDLEFFRDNAKNIMDVQDIMSD